MKQNMMFALLASCCAFGVSSAQADTISFNYNFDLTQPSYQEADLISFDGARIESQRVQVGDVVEMTYTFKPGQAINLRAGNSEQILWLGAEQDASRSKPNTSNFTIANLSFDLLGLRGNFQSPPAGAIHASGSSHIGSYFSGNFITPGQSVSFTGLRARFSVQELQDNAHYYNAPFFLLASLGGSVSVQAVPEAHTYAMLLGGFAVLALLRRRYPKPA
ncbi:hypothetical protein V8J88_00695 [Massilia sp. W12]|uniref:hypothetical protein n=1 Tax=Massilia sp. W12 TaxID=3126507 RepID=UPI0030CF49D6